MQETHDEFISRIRRENLAGLRAGVKRGWWDGVDEQARVPVRIVRRADFPSWATMAHVWVRIGALGCMADAKKAGLHKQPIETGQFRRGTFIVRVID